MPTSLDREWISSELDKGLAAERTLAFEARARAEAPPDPTLVLVYNELATAKDRHMLILETIAARYGLTPTRDTCGSMGGTFGWLKGKVTDLGTPPFDRLRYDLVARASSVLWYTAWVHTFQSVGDAEKCTGIGSRPGREAGPFRSPPGVSIGSSRPGSRWLMPPPLS